MDTLDQESKAAWGTCKDPASQQQTNGNCKERPFEQEQHNAYKMIY